MSQAIKIIDNAISFYNHAPDGQCDDIAVIALKYCRDVIDPQSNVGICQLITDLIEADK